MDSTACYNHITVHFFLISTIDPTLYLGDVRVDESGNDSQAILFSRLSVWLFWQRDQIPSESDTVYFYVQRAIIDGCIPIRGRKAVIIRPGLARGRFLASPSVLCLRFVCKTNKLITTNSR